MTRFFFIVVFFCGFFTKVKAQVNVDSLGKVWNDKKLPDKKRLKAFSNIIWGAYLNNNADTAFFLAQKLYDYAKQKKINSYIIDGLNLMGSAKFRAGDYKTALNYQEKHLALTQKLKNKIGISAAYSNLSSIMYEMGNYPTAIEYQFKSMRVDEELHDTSGVATSYCILGVIYQAQEENDKALAYYQKSKELCERVNDEYTMASTLINMGAIYEIKKDFGRALDYYAKGLSIFEKQQDYRGIAVTENNLAQLYMKNNHFEEAIRILNKAVKLEKKSGDKEGLASSEMAFSDLYLAQNNFDKSIEHGKASLDLANETGSVYRIKEAARALFEVYKKNKKYKLAIDMHKLYVEMNDSLTNDEAKKGIVAQEFKYAYDKKTLSDSLRREEARRTNTALQGQEKTQRSLLFMGLALGLFFGIVMILRYRKTNEQKRLAVEQTRLVDLQRIEVEEKQRELTDSILYARRIQDALLPSPKYLDKQIKRLKEVNKK
jgi:tetratricopeptide (TPR) repeat protein